MHRRELYMNRTKIIQLCERTLAIRGDAGFIRFTQIFAQVKAKPIGFVVNRSLIRECSTDA